MGYLISEYWIFIALAFVLGLFVGWSTHGGDGEPNRGRWFGWGIALFLAGVFVAVFHWLPGLTGHLFEVALTLFAAYVVGAVVGCGGHWPADETKGGGHSSRAAGGAGHGATAAAAPTAAAPQAYSHEDVLGVDSSASYPGERPALALAGAKADDLTKIAGLDAGTAGALGDIGVAQYGQIAAWGGPQVAWVEHHLAQTGRIGRENWIAQAKGLAAGGPAAASASSDTAAASASSQGASVSAAVAAVAAGAMTDGQRSILAAKQKMALKAQQMASAPAAVAATPAEPAAAAPAVPVAPRAPLPTPRPGMTDGQRSILAAKQKMAEKAARAAGASAAGAAEAGTDGCPAADSDPNAAADDLKLIKGIGPKNEAALNGLGVRRFGQIADWTPNNARWVGQSIKFPGRIEREQWILQAKFLAAGVDTPHSAAVKSGAITIDEAADEPMSEAEAQAFAESLPQQAAAVENESAYTGSRPLGLAAPRGGKADDLKLIKGIGKQNEERLHALGVWHFDQIAAWSAENVEWVGSYLAFPGRIDRENWIAQATALARGEKTAFSKRVESGDVPTSRQKPDLI